MGARAAWGGQVVYNPGLMNTRIAVVFDFDDTLAHDSTSAFLASLGVDVEPFWRKTVHPLLERGWDPMPAYMHRMIELSQSRSAGDRITGERLAAFGPHVAMYPGVADVFGRLQAAAVEVRGDAEVEFYCISSGIGEILRHTRIAGEFRRIFAGDFAYNDSDEIIAAKRLVSFTEKTRFLFEISKGVDDVNQRVEPKDYRIPMNQIIFVGDGATDIPCFTLAKKFGGKGFAVYDPDQPDKWGEKFRLIDDRRVTSMHTANYEVGSDLYNMLTMSVKAMAQKAGG